MKIKRAMNRRIFAHIRDKFPLALFVCALLLITLTTIGVLHVISTGKPEYLTPPDVLFKVLQILFFESGNITDDPMGWTLLGVTRILAPLFGILFSVYGVFIVFTEAFQRVLLRFKKKHIVLFGLGENGRKFIAGRNAHDYYCVVVAPDLSDKDKSFLKEYGVLYFKDGFSRIDGIDGNHDHVDDGVFLNKLLCKRTALCSAAMVLALDDDDGENIRNGSIVSSILKPDNNDAEYYGAKVIVEIKNLLAYQQVVEHGVFAGTAVHPVSFDLICARDALLKIAPLKNLFVDNAFKPIHLVVFGFGNLGEAFVKTIAEAGAHSDTEKIKALVVDPDAEDKIDRFLGMFPGIGKVMDITVVKGTAESRNVMNRLEEIANNPDVRPVFVITFNDPYLSAVHCMNIAGKPFCSDSLQASPVELYATISDSDYYAGWILRQGMNKCENDPYWKFLSNVTLFGMGENLYAPENLNNVKRKEQAMRFHDDYSDETVKMCKKYTIEPFPKVLWKGLDAPRRYSNFAALDHIPHKLSALGILPESHLPPIADITAKIDKHMDALAKLEHARYNAERFSNGWRYSPGKKDLVRKTNPTLVSWDELPSVKNAGGLPMQEYDRISIATMKKIVCEDGWGLF